MGNMLVFFAWTDLKLLYSCKKSVIVTLAYLCFSLDSEICETYLKSSRFIWKAGQMRMRYEKNSAEPPMEWFALTLGRPIKRNQKQLNMCNQHENQMRV